MLTFPDINPIAFAVPPFELPFIGSVHIQVHWYGIMYLIGFAGGWWLMRRRAGRPNSGWAAEAVDDLLFYAAMGVIVGGRVGYMLFYSFDSLVENPFSLLFLWKGGMSFHGGLVGVLIAMWLFARRSQRHWLAVVDFLVPAVPVGLGAGRIGNFINGELWGKVTDVPWAMVFPERTNAGSFPRHPSQLYEFLLEGVVLFIVLWVYSRKPRPMGAVAGVFGIGYGLFRFIVEFVRVPDEHIGYLAFDWLTMGQILSLPLIAAGIYLLWNAYWGNGHGSGKKQAN
jgi:phosphatidylglycerol:prolipoprotein diacylglycerol transferase